MAPGEKDRDFLTPQALHTGLETVGSLPTSVPPFQTSREDYMHIGMYVSRGIRRDLLRHFVHLLHCSWRRDKVLSAAAVPLHRRWRSCPTGRMRVPLAAQRFFFAASWQVSWQRPSWPASWRLVSSLRVSSQRASWRLGFGFGAAPFAMADASVANFSKNCPASWREVRSISRPPSMASLPPTCASTS